jgi:peptidoglycan hydrolase-like protein with peptidoglycan-binding domain
MTTATKATSSSSHVGHVHGPTEVHADTKVKMPTASAPDFNKIPVQTPVQANPALPAAGQAKTVSQPTGEVGTYTTPAPKFDDVRSGKASFQRGMIGNDVMQLQQKLNALGANPQLALDGKFGPKTEAALKAAQGSNGLQSSGVFDQQSLAMLESNPKAITDAQNTQHKLHDDEAVPSEGAVSDVGGSASERLKYASQRAKELGLTITSTTGGKHAEHSYHYKGRAIDVAGSPAKMAQFYKDMAKLNPTEAFYDPIGGIKKGQQIGPIGNHSDHVHVAF